MTKARAKPTELEGAILSLIRFVPGATAYRVRQIFLASRSAEWSGSAGAVYPAISRLEALGFLRSSPQSDKRGTRTFSLSRAGTSAQESWMCDAERAIGPGFDPFRIRAGFWPALAPSKQRTLLKQLQRGIGAMRADLMREYRTADAQERVLLDLNIALQDLRLRWIEAKLDAIAND